MLFLDNNLKDVTDKEIVVLIDFLLNFKFTKNYQQIL